MKIWILTRMKRVQIHGRPREDTLDEKDGMVAPRISVRRAHKAPRMKAPFNIPFDVENGKHDLLRHLIAQEINLMREDLEIASIDAHIYSCNFHPNLNYDL